MSEKNTKEKNKKEDKKIIFWDVDTQKDFMYRTGALFVSAQENFHQNEISPLGAEKIIPNLEKITQYAIKNNIKILGSVDRHFLTDSEMKKFPPHCIAGTDGQKKIQKTIPEGKHIFIDNRRLYDKKEIKEIIEKYQNIYFEKQDIPVFTNPNTSAFLKMLNPDIIIVYGVATDYCVRAAALGLADYFGIEALKKEEKMIYIVTDAIKEVNIDFNGNVDKEFGEKALKEIYKAGVNWIETSDIIIGNHLDYSGVWMVMK